MSNSVNIYEFIGLIMFNIEVHELVYVFFSWSYSCVQCSACDCA